MVIGQPTHLSHQKPSAVGFHMTSPPITTTRTRAIGRSTFQATYMS